MTGEADPAFEALLEFLREQRGFDFTGYKRASLGRRVRRRMEEVGVDGVEAYHDYLLVHPEEFTALFNTILINVTGFFRDTDAWLHLRHEVLPGILERRDGQPIRAWSAGCASGEEAYTLAILLAEALGPEEFRQRVKIYATDVDEEALAAARQGTYSERAVDGVPEVWRAKYFERAGQRFTFSRELRRSVIFGRNDLMQDAPISHVDVLCCRNTLMYFNADAQSHILQRMHFALRPDGVLFLGRAEMLLAHTELFRAIEIRRRFFTKVADAQRDRPKLGVRAAAAEDDGGWGALRQAALRTSPAALVVLDAEGRLALFTGRAAYLFGTSDRDLGRPFQDLELSYRPVELRSHIEAAGAGRHQVWVRDVRWTRGTGDLVAYDVQVVPLYDETGARLGTSITFHDVTHYRQLQAELEYANRQLETAYEELQSTNEELETTNEELQSTVEELETTNEELQSTNEELETMNEELQSMNDELQLTSEAQREEQDEAAARQRFLASVLHSLDAGIVVVDEQLRVGAWDGRAEDLWGIRAEEAVGSRLTDLDFGLPLDGVVPAVQELVDGNGGAARTLRLTAVNRRGRAIDLRVSVRRMVPAEPGAGAAGVLLVMDPAT